MDEPPIIVMPAVAAEAEAQRGNRRPADRRHRMQETDFPTDTQERAADGPADEPVRAWEEIEPGRFMPRRVRGSFQGGKLG
jgi:hypothetical protein